MSNYRSVVCSLHGSKSRGLLPSCEHRKFYSKLYILKPCPLNFSPNGFLGEQAIAKVTFMRTSKKEFLKGL